MEYRVFLVVCFCFSFVHLKGQSIYELLKSEDERVFTIEDFKGINLDTNCYQSAFGGLIGDATSPLQYAVTYRKHRLISLMLLAGANPNFQSPDGFTALHRAAFLNDTISITLLLEYRATVDAKANQHGGLLTPFLVAANWSKPNAAMLLVKNGADWSLKFDGKNALELMNTDRKSVV